MMGFGSTVSITSTTGRLTIIVSGDADNSTNGSGAQMQIRYGTGAAPANGAALTGTAAGSLVKMVQNNLNNRMPYSLNSIISGLTIGTTYWIDVSLAAITSGTARIRDNSISVHEI